MAIAQQTMHLAMRAARFKVNLILNYSIYIHYLHTIYSFVQVQTGLNWFSKSLASGHSEPLTGPSVQFFSGHEPWTAPRSGFAGFRFEPRFWTERYHPYYDRIMSNVDRSQPVTIDYSHCGLRNRFAINYDFRIFFLMYLLPGYPLFEFRVDA
jgi:hypothetical protein